MSSRRRSALVAVLLLAAGLVVWRAADLVGGNSTRPLTHSVIEFARESERPVAVVAETADGGPSAGSRDATHGVRVIPRDPAVIEEAARTATVVAGPSGREFLEALGYVLSSVPRSGAQQSMPLARVERRLRCTSVRADAWSPLPGLEYTGRLGVVLPASTTGSLVLVVGDDFLLDVGITSADGARAPVAREVLPSITAAPPDYWIEGRSPRDAPGAIQQLTISASPGRAHVLSVRLGRRAPRVLARLRRYEAAARASVCAAPVASDTAFAHGATAWVLVPDVAPHFGAGWSDALVDPQAGSVRWMNHYGALLVPFARRGRVRVRLHGYRDGADGEVSLRVNDMTETTRLLLRGGVHDYEWTLPAAAWVAGTNEILVRVAARGAGRLFAVQRVQLTLEE